MPAHYTMGSGERRTLPQAKERRPRGRTSSPTRPLSGGECASSWRRGPVPAFSAIWTLVARVGEGRTQPHAWGGRTPCSETGVRFWETPPRPPLARPQPDPQARDGRGRGAESRRRGRRGAPSGRHRPRAAADPRPPARPGRRAPLTPLWPPPVPPHLAIASPAPGAPNRRVT